MNDAILFCQHHIYLIFDLNIILDANYDTGCPKVTLAKNTAQIILSTKT